MIDNNLPPLAPAERSARNPVEAAEARRALIRALSKPAEEKRRFQFSLIELTALTTFAAAVMAAGHYLPLTVFTGLVGCAAVLVMYFEQWIPAAARWLRAAWIVLGATYLVSALAALVAG